MAKKEDISPTPEITMVDIMDEIKDLAEIIDIVHSELSDIKSILLQIKPSKSEKDKEPNKEGSNGYMHG